MRIKTVGKVSLLTLALMGASLTAKAVEQPQVQAVTSIEVLPGSDFTRMIPQRVTGPSEGKAADIDQPAPVSMFDTVQNFKFATGENIFIGFKETNLGFKNSIVINGSFPGSWFYDKESKELIILRRANKYEPFNALSGAGARPTTIIQRGKLGTPFRYKENRESTMINIYNADAAASDAFLDAWVIPVETDGTFKFKERFANSLQESLGLCCRIVSPSPADGTVTFKVKQ